MKWNKEKFLKTELGANMVECLTAWDKWLIELRKFSINGTDREYIKTRKAAEGSLSDGCKAVLRNRIFLHPYR